MALSEADGVETRVAAANANNANNEGGSDPMSPDSTVRALLAISWAGRTRLRSGSRSDPFRQSEPRIVVSRDLLLGF